MTLNFIVYSCETIVRKTPVEILALTMAYSQLFYIVYHDIILDYYYLYLYIFLNTLLRIYVKKELSVY